MANSPSGDSIVGRITRLLETFDSTRVAQSPSAIARRAGLPISTTHRLVAQLVEEGMLERDGDGDVRIGIRLWELTTRGSHALRLRQIAMPFMEQVQQRVHEHTQLGVLEHDEVLFIERLSAPGSGANITRIAGRLPLHASSSGLVLLAFGDAALQQRMLTAPLAPVSAETITDPAALRRELAAIRTRGYAFAPGYVEAVSTGIAVPVADRSGVVAALSVVVPRGAVNEAATVEVLKRAAAGIGESLSRSPFASRSME